MNYETFLKEKERIADLPDQEQKDFYAKVLEEEQKESDVKLLAYFQYAVLFYYEGDFRRTIEILEPFTISYQSYEYRPEMIACFNLMGVAAQCEGEYILARYCFNLALRVVNEKKAVELLAREYNNLSLTYISEQDYETALDYIRKAEQHLAQADENMGAYVFLNKSDIYNHFGKPDLALKAFTTCIKEYNGLKVLPDDTLICGVSLFYRMGNKNKYTDYIGRVLEKLGDMYASEFIDACKVIFDCSLDSGDYKLVERVIAKMDDYMQTHPHENRVGLKVEELKYTYAKKVGDMEAELAALEKKNHYYELIVLSLENQRAVSMDEYLETNKHLQEAVLNESQANRAKTRFLANMSHDIRTPMNAIMGIANLMEHSLNNMEKTEEYLSKLQISSRHMLGLINDLLDMNKIESGTYTLNEEPMRLADQIMQIEDIIRTQAAERGQDFQICTRHIRHENLTADAIRLRQIMLNVLSNSVKYTPKGGEIQFNIEELTSDNTDKARYRFVVKDNGIGMDEELLDHIFDPFIRGEDSVVNKIQGTGLGMSITKSIVEMMDGSIHVESKVNEGSCVTIILEFDIDKEEDSRMEPLKILMISEESELISDISAAVQTKPISFTWVSNWEKAESTLEKFHADVVLLHGRFSRNPEVRKLRNDVSSEALFIALTDTQTGISPKDLKKNQIDGSIACPFFFTNLEKEVNRIRSSSGEKVSESVLKGMRFLCAEDNELNAEILKASLEIAGAKCTIYADGAELVNAFDSVKPGEYEAILMDIQMPNMNGYQASKAIREMSGPKSRIPIIAMTANAFDEDKKKAVGAGMNAHVAKPFDIQVLLDTMEQELKRKRF